LQRQKTKRKKKKDRRRRRRHSFTINTPPYSVDIDTAAGETGNATFTANQEGIFQYYCKYRPPTMRAQPVMLPQSPPGESPSAT
jgi:hypothetical protein